MLYVAISEQLHIYLQDETTVKFAIEQY